MPVSRRNDKGRSTPFSRRDFLSHIAKLMATSPLILWSERARSMTPFAFWKKRASAASVGVYPTDTSDDPYWDYVVLCMNMDTPTPSNTAFNSVFTDESNVGRTTAVNGAPYVDTATNSSPYSGRTGSAVFNGSSDYVYIDSANEPSFDFSGDFTIETRVYMSAINRDQYIAGYNAGGNSVWGIQVEANNKARGDFKNSAGTGFSVSSTTTLSANTWYHLAFVKNGTSLTLYLNGSSEGSVTFTGSGSHTVSGRQLAIGRPGATNSLYWQGKVADLRIYNGIAKYTANFTPSTSPIGLGTANDKYWGYCVLACPFENSLKDMGGKRIVSAGNTTLTTSQKKYGTASLSLSGSGDYLAIADSSDWHLGVSDFTVEFYVYMNATGNYTFVSQDGHPAGSSRGWGIQTNGSNIQFFFSTNGSTATFVDFAWSPSSDVWYHIAFCRTGTELRAYINGTAIGTTYNMGTSSIFDSTKNLMIGAHTPTSANLNGHIDSLRITKGVARYTSNFTPPSASFPVGKDETVDPFWNFTVLAMHMDDLTDSVGQYSFTNSGSVSNNTTTKKFGTASALFNGSSQYLQSTTYNTTGFDLQSAQDLTIEAWVYLTSAATSMIFQYGTSSANIINLYSSSDGSLSFGLYDDSGSYFAGNAAGSLKTGVWNHVVGQRRGGVVESFVNGIKGGTTSSVVGALRTPTDRYLVVGRSLSNGTSYFPGYIDDLRITKGVARYVNNFTPPTRAFATGPQDSYALTLHDAANSIDVTADRIVTDNTYLYVLGRKKDGSGNYTSTVTKINSLTMAVVAQVSINFATERNFETAIYYNGYIYAGGRLTGDRQGIVEIRASDLSVTAAYYATNGGASEAARIQHVFVRNGRVCAMSQAGPFYSFSELDSPGLAYNSGFSIEFDQSSGTRGQREAAVACDGSNIHIWCHYHINSNGNFFIATINGSNTLTRCLKLTQPLFHYPARGSMSGGYAWFAGSANSGGQPVLSLVRYNPTDGSVAMWGTSPASLEGIMNIANLNGSPLIAMYDQTTRASIVRLSTSGINQEGCSFSPLLRHSSFPLGGRGGFRDLCVDSSGVIYACGANSTQFTKSSGFIVRLPSLNLGSGTLANHSTISHSVNPTINLPSATLSGENATAYITTNQNPISTSISFTSSADSLTATVSNIST